jgi:hypothetical protein
LRNPIQECEDIKLIFHVDASPALAASIAGRAREHLPPLLRYFASPALASPTPPPLLRYFCKSMNDLPDDVLARVIIPYCALKERIRMIETCKHIRRAIMSKRMSLGVDESIVLVNESMLIGMPCLINNFIVRSIKKWVMINKDAEQIRSIRSLNMSYDVMNLFTRISPRPPPFCDTFSASTCEVVLPPNLTALTLLAMSDHAMFWKLKRSVIGWVLPSTLTSINMGEQFNNPVIGWVLPASLTSIHMGCEFNRKVIGWVLPTSLTSINMGSEFNNPVIGWSLPNTLTSIDMGMYFDDSVIGWLLPPSLTSIKMGREFNRSVIGWKLPASLTSIKMGWKFNNPVIGWELPPGLMKLNMGKSFNQPVIGWTLPDHLESIIMANEFDQPVIGWSLPQYLSSLSMGLHFDHDVIGWVLPHHLLSINMGSNFNKPVIGWKMPQTLQILKFLHCFNSPVIGWALPNSVSSIKMGEDFNQQVIGWILPPHISTLTFGTNFDKPIDMWIIPSSLSVITKKECDHNLLGEWTRISDTNHILVYTSLALAASDPAEHAYDVPSYQYWTRRRWNAHTHTYLLSPFCGRLVKVLIHKRK